MPRFITPGKSPLKRVRFYRTRQATAIQAVVAPIAITSFVPGVTSSNAVTVATASITPLANRLYLASVTSLTAVSVAPNPPTLSGNGISWVLYGASVFDDTGTSLARATFFYGISASPTAGVLTADFGTQLQDTAILVVDEATNVNVASPVVQVAVNQNKTAATDLVVSMAAFSSTNNATYATFSKEATAAVATPLGGIANLALFDVSGKITVQTAYQIGNSPLPGESWSLACQSSGIAIEINSVASAFVNSVTAAPLEDSDLAAGSASSLVSTNGSTLESADSAAGVIASLIAATGSTLEDPDSSAGVIASVISTNGAPVESFDSSAGTIASVISTTGSTAESRDSSTGNITSSIATTGAAYESPDSASGSASSVIGLSAAAIETPDSTTGNVTTVIASSGAAFESDDVAAGTIVSGNSTTFNGAALESSDIAAGLASPVIALTSNSLESRDAVDGNASSTIAASGAVLESPDIASGNSGTVNAASGAVLEDSDRASGISLGILSVSGQVIESPDNAVGLFNSTVIVVTPPTGGGVPRQEHWKVNKPQRNRDESLDDILKKAYDKATGKVFAPIAVIEAIQENEVITVTSLEDDEDEDEVLMLLLGIM